MKYTEQELYKRVFGTNTKEYQVAEADILRNLIDLVVEELVKINDKLDDGPCHERNKSYEY